MDINQMKQDLADTKTNLTEAQGDIDEIMGLNQQQLTKIGNLETQVADLQKQLGNLPELEAIAAGLKEVKDLSRQVADKQPEPPVTPA